MSAAQTPSDWNDARSCQKNVSFFFSFLPFRLRYGNFGFSKSRIFYLYILYQKS